MTTVAYAHIELTDEDVPVLAGTQTKVEEVILDHLAHSWDADEICRQHPHHSQAGQHGPDSERTRHGQEGTETL